MSTGRGRRVRFPPKSEEPTPASPVPSLGPVVFTLEFAGKSERFDLSDLPCPRLTRSLARALAEIGGDGGTRRYLDGYKQVIACVSRFVRFIAHAEQECGGEFDIDDLEPMMLNAFETTLIEQYGHDSAWPHDIMSQLVFVIRRAYENDPDSLTDEMRGRINYSSSHAKGRDQPLDAYPFLVMDKIESAALADIREILNRIHQGEQLSIRGTDPPDGRWWLKPEDVMYRIANHGPLTSEERWKWTIRDVMGGIRAVNSQLFLTLTDLVPFHILLICQTGLEPDCVKALRADCLINPSRGFVSITYTKKRGHRGEAQKSIRVTDGGSPSHPGGLIRLVQRLTHRARAICGTESLWAVVDKGYAARPAFDRRRTCRIRPGTG